MNSDLSEQFLNKLYEDLLREQHRLMSDIKSSTTAICTDKKDKGTHKQIQLLSSIMMNAIKLRDLRNKVTWTD